MAEKQQFNFCYKPDMNQLDDWVYGYQYQQYDNSRMIYADSWYKYLQDRRGFISLCAAAAAGLLTFIFNLYFSAINNTPFFIVLTLTFVITFTVWVVLNYGEKKTNAVVLSAFVRWQIEFEADHAKTYNVHISEEGFTQRTNCDEIKLSWLRYHCALLQPANLILVFQGTIVVIPNEALAPFDAQEVGEQINAWVNQFNQRYTLERKNDTQ
ncbi:hypothetical protein [Bartonella sp. LJL80]